MAVNEKIAEKIIFIAFLFVFVSISVEANVETYAVVINVDPVVNNISTYSSYNSYLVNNYSDNFICVNGSSTVYFQINITDLNGCMDILHDGNVKYRIFKLNRGSETSFSRFGTAYKFTSNEVASGLAALYIGSFNMSNRDSNGTYRIKARAYDGESAVIGNVTADFNYSWGNCTIPTSSGNEEGGGGIRRWKPSPSPTESSPEKQAGPSPSIRHDDTEGKEDDRNDDSGEENILFDIIVEPVDVEVTGDGFMNAKISLINFGVPGNVDVHLHYTIRDTEGDAIYTEDETRSLRTQAEFIKSFKLPPGSEEGDYNLDVTLSYGDEQEAYSKALFKNLGKHDMMDMMKEHSLLITAAAAIIIGAISILFIVGKKKRKD